MDSHSAHENQKQSKERSTSPNNRRSPVGIHRKSPFSHDQGHTDITESLGKNLVKRRAHSFLEGMTDDIVGAVHDVKEAICKPKLFLK